jgi:hypothetical protein
MRYIIFILMLSFTFSASAACRSTSVKRQFDKQQGYPHGRPGYIVDHVCALSCGGLDIVGNMQYQSVKASREKDKWETTPQGCAATCNSKNSKPVRTVFNCN